MSGIGVPFLFRGTFFSSFQFPLLSVCIESVQPGHMQVITTLRRFIANYSRINQSGTWGPVSGSSASLSTPHERPGGQCCRTEGYRLASSEWALAWSFPRVFISRTELPPDLPCTSLPEGHNGRGSPAGVLDQRKTFSVQGVGGPRLGSWEGTDNLKEPWPRGQQMRGRCEVPRRGGKAAVGAGRPCDVNVGRLWPAAPEPGSSAEHHLSRGRGVYAARPALMYTFSAQPLSLLGPGKRVVTFAVNNEF